MYKISAGEFNKHRPDLGAGKKICITKEAKEIATPNEQMNCNRDEQQ
jgi:hypothetical protein